MALQRCLTGQTQPATVPSAVRAALRSPSQPLDTGARAFFEPRFGHDFSKVRVHSDSKAAESAQAVNALAYTVGNHISFGDGSYHPRSNEGRKLIAHELAHVVQQSQNGGGISAGESHFEAEADRAASAVTSEGARPVLTVRGQPGLQRQPKSSTPTSPQPSSPTKHQQDVIDGARRAAAIRCQIAMFRVRGITPAGPSGRIDATTELGMRARSLARVMFQWDNPNMEQIGEVVSSMVNFLTSGVPVMIAAAKDPQCGNRAAYVRGLRPPIVLCPDFFSASSEQRIRTMIHEAAHLARIGSADLGESYCVDFDCVTSCGGVDSADSWAHFVHCLSGQRADQPTTITGRSPARQGQTQQHGAGGGP
jgi:predicted metallopeptidase